MTRGQLPKAYLRMDPDIDAKHPDYLDEFVKLLCVANRQPWRGRFRNRGVVEALVGKPATKRAIERGDLIPAGEHECRDCPPGDPKGTELYLDGWDTWQEGDLSVADRMRQYRTRKSRNTERNAGVTPTVTDPYPAPSPTSEAGDNKTTSPEPPNPHEADELELLVDEVLRHPGTPGQLRAVRGLSRAVGMPKTLEVLRYWRDEGNADDPFGAALDQLGAMAAAAKKRKRTSSKWDYLDETPNTPEAAA